jgi:hypothetical protein
LPNLPIAKRLLQGESWTVLENISSETQKLSLAIVMLDGNLGEHLERFVTPSEESIMNETKLWNKYIEFVLTWL